MKDPWSKCLDRLFWVTVETGKYNVVECRTVVSGDYTQKNPQLWILDSMLYSITFSHSSRHHTLCKSAEILPSFPWKRLLFKNELLQSLFFKSATQHPTQFSGPSSPTKHSWYQTWITIIKCKNKSNQTSRYLSKMDQRLQINISHYLWMAGWYQSTMLGQ